MAANVCMLFAGSNSVSRGDLAVTFRDILNTFECTRTIPFGSVVLPLSIEVFTYQRIIRTYNSHSQVMKRSHVSSFRF